MELRIEGAIVKIIPLIKPVLRIGRNKSADLIIPDPFISGIHCQLSRLDSGVWVLTDGDLIRSKPSTHGTWLNGRQLAVDEGAIIGHRDVFVIGKTTITLWEEREQTKAIEDETPTYY